MDVTLEPAADRRATIENLFQFYVHDFSDFWIEPQVDLGEDGRFPPYPPLESYWAGDPRRAAYLIRADQALAGFVLLNDHSHSGRPADFNVAEFFVARPYRRGGVGRAAALAAITPRRGQWEIAVARRNLAAQAFWRQIAAAAAAGDIEETDQDDDRWNGMILRFVVA
ncbi:GNAT family N-acetyltransferase [Phenylobacterium sp.]|uniref:GNAT family N-acetyltransferase n=1 Tax=Phenylobacterium sp. TaxID=1871053 RepID=UPI00301D2DA0